MKTVAIIGAGPAGLMAAEVLSHSGAQVTVYDAMPSVGRKFLMAGKSGLNLTHSEPFEQFVARYGTRRSRIEPMLKEFGADELRVWAKELGIETFVGTSGRVFPTSMKASPLLRASGLHAQLLSALINGRRLVFVHKWDPARAIDMIRDQRVTAFQAAPSMIMQVLEHPQFDFDQMRKQLSAMGFGGSGLPQRLIDEVLQRFGPSMSGIGFGLTESNGVGSAISGDGFANEPLTRASSRR